MIEYTHTLINMSTYMNQFDSYQYHEYANVYEVMVYLLHGIKMLMMSRYVLKVMEDLDENQ